MEIQAENYFQLIEREAVAKLTELMKRPTISADGCYSSGERFVPWDLFPAVYGTYNSIFDDLAIEVLTDIRDMTFNRDDLAAEMFREMLCTTGLCAYGTSPRVCFASTGFKPVLPEFIERWKEYAAIMWDDE